MKNLGTKFKALIGLSDSNAGLEVVYSDADLTKIYNEANGLDPKRHNSITTERIFKAMRECLNIGEAMSSNVKLRGDQQRTKP